MMKGRHLQCIIIHVVLLDTETLTRSIIPIAEYPDEGSE